MGLEREIGLGRNDVKRETNMRGNWKRQCPRTTTSGDFNPKFMTVVDCCSIVTVHGLWKTISYVIKQIKMIADALFP